VVYGVYGPGDYFGEMSLDGGPRSASVMVETTCTCAVLTRQTLREHIKAEPEFAFELMARVIRRARLATQSARSMALLDVYERMVQLLESLAVAQPDGAWLVGERLTHADVAARLGCSREMVSRLMKDLENGGFLSHCDKKLWINKRLPKRW
jgi:CRP/FNR family transcriptional regulator, cyclic AMP receptor protein